MIIAELLILLVNLGVLAITVKLYTEILKDQRFEGRAKKHGHDGGVGIESPFTAAMKIVKGEDRPDIPEPTLEQLKEGSMKELDAANMRQINANIQLTNANAIRALVDAGFKHDNVVKAVTTGDLAQLKGGS